MLDVNKMKTYGVVTMKTFYKEKRNERKQHSKQDRWRTLFAQIHNHEREELVPHETFSRYVNSMKQDEWDEKEDCKTKKTNWSLI